MATRPKGYLTKGKTKSVDAVRKAKAKEAFTPKGIGGMVAGALLSGAPIGRGGKAAVGVAKIIKQAITRKDPITTAAIKKSAKYIKNMDKLERKENKVTSLASAKTRANIDKMEKSGNYKKVGKAKPKPKSAMKTTTEYKKNRDKLEYGNPKRKPADAPTSAKPALSRVLRENRMRDLKAKKYQGSLSKEPKPLSKTPRLSNDTKKLLEKFQTPKVRPPATRTSLGGMIGEARPLAKAQRRQAAAEELKKRPVTKRKVNPEDIRKSRIEAAKAAKAARKNRIESLRKPVRPPRAKTNRAGNGTG
jgi:hypothetical protein